MELLWRTKGDAESSLEESKELQFFVPQHSDVPAAFLPPGVFRCTFMLDVLLPGAPNEGQEKWLS